MATYRVPTGAMREKMQRQLLQLPVPRWPYTPSAPVTRDQIVRELHELAVMSEREARAGLVRVG